MNNANYEENKQLIKEFESLVKLDTSYEEKAKIIDYYVNEKKIEYIPEIHLCISMISFEFMEEFNVAEDYYGQVYNAFCNNMLDEAYNYRYTKMMRFSEDDELESKQTYYLHEQEKNRYIKEFESLVKLDVSFEKKAMIIKYYVNDKKIEYVPEIFSSISEIVEDFMEEYNIDQDYYGQVYDAFCKNMLDTAYYYRDTKVERFSEDDIIVTLEDEQLSQDYIKNGIEYCAYYIAEKILERNFVKGPISLEMIEIILRRYNNHYIDNGSIIEPEKIAIFIKSLIDILNKEYRERILKNANFSKNASIGVLGFNHFAIPAGKKFESNYPGKSREVEDGYFLDSIDNDYSKTIGEALAMVGLEGMFTKAANKMRFYVKNKRFGYVSMNSGHWIPKFDVTSKEKLEEYKLSVIARITKDLPSELKESIISYLLYNGEQELLNQQTVHKR